MRTKRYLQNHVVYQRTEMILRNPKQVKMKHLVVADMSKRCNDTNNRLKEFSALYDVVKNERNKYVNLIQASHQALAEMKEKIKILRNEVTTAAYIRTSVFCYGSELKRLRICPRGRSRFCEIRLP